ncbi:MAG: methyltransferase domain-containing protein [Spirosomaceae bacterium]|nr:methyltransferase domain-containing protein [Spirosomataceae bacterium]
MQLRVSPENPLEWLALKTNQVPVPLLHVQMYFVMAKAVMEAVEAGIFGAIEAGIRSSEAIAAHCGLHPRPTSQLLNLLVSMEYLRLDNEAFCLTPMAQKWIAPSSPDSVAAIALYNNRVAWNWVTQLGDYLRTGEGRASHEVFDASQWQLYQNAMHAVAQGEVREFIKRIKLPKNVRHLLDIGGANGQHTQALCQKHPQLHATILDLPEAIQQAENFLENSPVKAQIAYQKGNALTDNLGENCYDMVLLANVAHHFTEAQNRDLAQRVAISLRKGGIFVVNEFIRPDAGSKPELVGSSSDLFFGLTSTSGNWTVAEIQAWQQEAGLYSHKIIRYLTIPGMAMVIAKKL